MNMLTLSLATALLGERIGMQQEGKRICKNFSQPFCRSEMPFLYCPEMSTTLDRCSCKRFRQEIFTLTSLHVNDSRMKRLNKPACKVVFGQERVPKIPGLCTILFIIGQEQIEA